MNMQADLNRFVHFCEQNNLFLNLKKYFSITFTRNKLEHKFVYKIKDMALSNVDHVRDLGIMVDSKLKFDIHVDAVAASASIMLWYVLQKCARCSNVKTIVCLYSSLVLSKLSLCSVQSGIPDMPSVLIDQLERIQRRFLKFISFKSFY